VLELLRRANRHWSSPAGDILRSLLSRAGDEPELLAQLQEQASDAGSGMWLTVLGRAVARGEARPEALHPRVATVAVVLLRNEYVTRGIPTVPDGVLVEIVDEVYPCRWYADAARHRADRPAAEPKGTRPPVRGARPSSRSAR